VVLMLTVSHGVLFDDSWYAAGVNRRLLPQPLSGVWHRHEKPSPRRTAEACVRKRKSAISFAIDLDILSGRGPPRHGSPFVTRLPGHQGPHTRQPV